VSKRRVILIVEDDVDLRRTWRLALQLEGFEVDEAGDGIAALRRLEERRPDLVVLDLGLPALGGLSVQQEIAAQAMTMVIPIVIVTGSPEDLSHVDVSCVLRKPVTLDELVNTVRRCLGSGASSVVSPSQRAISGEVTTRRDKWRTSTGRPRRSSGR
jgi:two-component system response regulator MprA